MNSSFHIAANLTLAQAATAIRVRKLEWPHSSLGWFVLLGGGAAVLAWVIWQYRRDTRDLAAGCACRSRWCDSRCWRACWSSHSTHRTAHNGPHSSRPAWHC